ncbi:MAG TPA: putative glycoside hydrolase [Burkholderiales bacterium]|nr:putative glycoside hydrolase [Burkholderiales bacterium]
MRRSTVRLLLAAVLLATASMGRADTFPRLMGMNIGAKHYEDPLYQEALARLDVAILGFYRGWNPAGYAASPTAAMRKVAQAIKARNPRILLGQYTVLNEARDDALDLRDKLDAQQWWLRDAAGRRVQWTKQYAAWEINFTAWAKPDAKGLRWPEWLAERNHAVYFRDVPEFDIVYLDNLMSPLRVTGDWDGDGANDGPQDPKIISAHYAGHRAHWRRLRELRPGLLQIANTDNDLSHPLWRDQLAGGFLEALMGEHWSIEARGGWAAMMQRYRAVMRHTQPPKLVGFNVHGNPADYRFFRYAYASCLLDDGHFSFTDRALGYSSVPWFDEYEHKLGRALSPTPVAAWREGVWRRDFEHGVVLVNPGSAARTVEVEPGLRRLAGQQDPAVNDGAAVSRLRLPPKDGIVLRRAAGAGQRTTTRPPG